MISVIIPALDSEHTLADTLTALIPAAVEGLVREVIVVDGGSRDRTAMLAEGAGADIVRSQPGRGLQLVEGARRAKFPWLLFLHADTVLEPGWERDAAIFMERVEAGKSPPAMAAFSFALDDEGVAPRLLEAAVRVRCHVWHTPYGDQGYLIPRHLYDETGGFKALALMEDVDLLRRLGRRRVHVLRARARTSPSRYRKHGYVRRIARNQACLALYRLGVPIERIMRLYQG